MVALPTGLSLGNPVSVGSRRCHGQGRSVKLGRRYRLACVGMALWAAPVDAGAQSPSQEPKCAPMAPNTAGPGAAQGGPVPKGRIRGPVPRIDIDVTRQGARWAATLTARYPEGGTGTRHLQAATCAELQRAIAVSLSLLDASEASSTGSPSTAAVAGDATVEGGAAASSDDVAAAPSGGDVAPPGAARPPSVSLDAPSETSALASSAAAPDAPAGMEHALGDRSRAAPTVFMRGGGLVATAGGQFVELGVALSGGMWLGSWGARFELSARESVSAISAEGEVGVEIQRLTAELDLCTRASRGVEWGVCGGPRLELVTGLPSRVMDPAPDVVWLPGVGTGVWMRWPIGSDWALWSELQGNVSPWGGDYDLPLLGASLLAGVEWATQ